MLLLHDTQGDYIQGSTIGNDDTKKNKVGLVMGHAYTVLKAQELSNGVKLIKIRNPWGRETYKGPWEDKSELWTDALREEVGLVVDYRDGIFWTDIDTYVQNFKYTKVSYNADGWASSKFLKIDD